MKHITLLTPAEAAELLKVSAKTLETHSATEAAARILALIPKGAADDRA